MAFFLAFHAKIVEDVGIELVDKNGATVASYVYDTWGKLVSIKDVTGANDPFSIKRTLQS